MGSAHNMFGTVNVLTVRSSGCSDASQSGEPCQRLQDFCLTSCVWLVRALCSIFSQHFLVNLLNLVWQLRAMGIMESGLFGDTAYILSLALYGSALSERGPFLSSLSEPGYEVEVMEHGESAGEVLSRAHYEVKLPPRGTEYGRE